MRGILVKPFEKATDFTFDMKVYSDLYPVLECDTFDCIRRKFGNNYYDIYLDDNGLLLNKEPAIFTRDETGRNIVEMLVGNCFICNHDEDGATISLTDEQVKEVLSSNVKGVMYCRL